MNKSGWVEPFSLSFDQRKQLSNILKLAPKSDAVKSMRVVIEQCVQLQRILDKTHDVTLGEEHADLSDLMKSLKAAQRVTRRLDRSGCNPELSMFYDKRLPEAQAYGAALRRKYSESVSNLDALISEIKGSIERHINSLPKPKKGAAKKTSYTDSLVRVAEAFKQIHPEREISFDEKSMFRKLVLFFLNDVLGDDIQNPKRDIETLKQALNS